MTETIPQPTIEKEARRDRGLAHTCASHPSGGVHGPECVSYCGLRPHLAPGTSSAKRIVRDGSSCVVCDSMFDARFR